MQYTTGDSTVDSGNQTIYQLNELLRGEISAAETYRLAIDKAADSANANDGLLRGIQEEHGRAAQGLRARIRELGGEATDSSGAWGVWAKTVQGTMNVFGDQASLKALKEGEEHGLKGVSRSGNPGGQWVSPADREPDDPKSGTTYFDPGSADVAPGQRVTD